MSRTDALLAGGLLAVGLLEAALSAGPGDVTALAPVPVLTLPLAYRRRAPVAVAVVVTAALVGPVVAGSTLLLEGTFTGFICVLTASYTLGRRQDGRAFAVATVACAGALALTIGLNDSSVASGALAAMIVLASTVGGRVVRDRALLVEALERQALELDAAARLQVDTATARERDRLSRELTGLVSEGVSEMVLQVRAARGIASSDPGSAIASIAAVETAGKRALGEMRSLLGTLRRGDEELALAPRPSLARLGTLVERARRGGRAVELSVEGEEPGQLPPGVDAAAYRIVEEVLAAAERQGGTWVNVRVAHTRHVLEVELSSDGPLSEDGPDRGATETGLEGCRAGTTTVGIRERVAAFNGDVWTGSTGSTYALRARLSLTGRPVRAVPGPRPGGAAGGGGEPVQSSQRAYGPARRLRAHLGGLAILAVSALAVVEAAATPARQGSSLANALVAAAIAAPLPLARSRPVMGSALAWAAASVMGAFLTPVSEVPSLFVVLLLFPYHCARYAAHRGAWAGLVVTLGGVLVVNVVQGTVAWGDLVFPPLLLSLSWVVGRMARSRAVMAREVAEGAQRLEQARDEQAAALAAAERRRIARELHDVVAHTLSVMVIQAGAARWTFERDPARASDALEIVEQTGRAALVELRRLLGFLDPLAGAETISPQPGLGQLGDLVERTRRAGMPVELRVEGQAAPLPPALDLAAYRIAQEALTNALRHAEGAPAQLNLRYSEEAVYVEVINDGGPRSAKERGGQHGYGLTGMRERVSTHGGELFAGPLAGGGFAVRARLPIREGEASPEHPRVVEDPAANPTARSEDQV